MDESSATDGPPDSATSSDAPLNPLPNKRPPILSYRSASVPGSSNGPQERLVTLRRMDATEAQLAQMKLESEGIRCFVAGQHLSATHPLLFSDVRLQVAEGDAQIAEQILNCTTDEISDGEYADEEWRCPQCHRKTVDLIGLSKRERRLRIAYLFVLGSPLLVIFVDWLLSNPRSSKVLADWSQLLGLIWLFGAAGLSFVLLTRKRRKHCRSCGHEWGEK